MVHTIIFYTTVGNTWVEQVMETLTDMRKKYKISVSPGNRKMGGIPSISLPPIATCSPALACFNSDCYAKRMTVYRPNILTAWYKNYTTYQQNSYAYKELVKDKIRTIQSSGGNHYFRWHVGGDIVDQKYFDIMCSIANEMEDTKFMVFTKKYHIADLFKRKPDNLAVLISMWPNEDPLIQSFINANWKSLRDIRRAKIAWLEGDPRIRSEGFNTYNCHGSCVNCKQCWTDMRDIILTKH